MAWTGRRALGGHFPAPASFDPAVRVFIGVVLLFAAGCAEPLAWSKPGGTSEGFAKDRYECFQEARVPYSGAYVNPYYGSSAGGIRIDDNLATACLEARGWRLGKQQPLASPARAGFDEGVAAYNRGDYAAALREFLPLAQQGNADAQTNLGVMYDAHFGHRDHSDRSIVITPIGGS